MLIDLRFIQLAWEYHHHHHSSVSDFQFHAHTIPFIYSMNRVCVIDGIKQ